MNRFFIIAIFLTAFYFNYQVAYSQGKVTQALTKLNRVHKQGRLMFVGNTPQIFLNAEDRILDMGNYVVPLENVQTTYAYVSRNLPNKKYDGVKFSCFDGNCIKFLESENGSSITIFFKTKKDCYDFINVLNELKKALEETQ